MVWERGNRSLLLVVLYISRRRNFIDSNQKKEENAGKQKPFIKMSRIQMDDSLLSPLPPLAPAVGTPGKERGEQLAVDMPATSNKGKTKPQKYRKKTRDRRSRSNSCCSTFTPMRAAAAAAATTPSAVIQQQ